MKYRADIDGLRAVAVLSITAFHLRTFAPTGGYVGVDIFYVISGFLIGGNVFAEQAAGRFSIRSFYHRRFRRIVPALIVMLAGVTVAALLLFYPPTLIDYAQSMIAAALSVSNVYFWLNTDYFSPSAFELPLLHTWSLGVEEQFYLLFPPLILGLRGRSRRLTTYVLWGVATASLALSIVGVALARDATFYLLPTRIWEILLGALVARTAIPQLDRDGVREVVATGGAVLIGAPILFFSEATPFPGLAALFPCIGTAALIAAGRAGPSLANRILAWRPLVFVGLISYSLYLWHWPVIVLMQRAFLEPNLVGVQKIVALGLSLLLGTASWWLVERPFRTNALSMRAIYRATAVGLGAVTIIGLVIIAGRGLPRRFDPTAVTVAAFLGYTPDVYRGGLCHGPSLAHITTFGSSVCLARSESKPNVLVLGDSHAAHLWWGLHRRYPAVNVMQASASGSGCKPALDQPPSVPAQCSTLMAYMLRRYLPTHKPDLLVISASWEPTDAVQLAATLEYLRNIGVRTVVSGPIEAYTMRLPLLLAQQIDRHDPDLAARHRSAASEPLDRQIGDVAQRAKVPYISLYQYLCGRSSCITEAMPGVPLQFDTAHLTGAGSVRVAGAFAAVIQRLGHSDPRHHGLLRFQSHDSAD